MAKVHINRMDEKKIEELRKNPVDYEDDGTIEELIKEGLKAVDWEKTVKKGSTVLLKVNGCHYRFMPGIVTVPAVTGLLVGLLRDRAGDVIVCESDLQRWDADVVLRDVGYKKVTESAGGRVLNLSKDKMVETEVNGEFWDKRPFPKTFQDADVFISQPIPKTHKNWYISVGIKNQFGCVPEADRVKIMKYLPKVMADVNSLLKPRITMVDGTFGLGGDGPIAGIPMRLGTFIFSDNVVAADITAGDVMGLDPFKSQLITHAIERGLGSGDRKDFKYSGTPLSDFTYKFKPPAQDFISRMERRVRNYPNLANFIYRSFFFSIAKKVAWMVRSASGYKNQYIEDVEATGVWEGYDYRHLLETKPTEG